MTKNCPNCGKLVPDDAKFCMDCGYAFDGKQNKNMFSNGSIFLILIAVILVVGGIFIITSSFEVEIPLRRLLMMWNMWI